MRGRITKGMVAVLVLSAVGECAPALVDCTSSAVVGSVTRLRVEIAEFCLGTVNIAGRNHSSQVVAGGFHKPPVRNPGIFGPVIGIKSLPAAPGAFLMVMVGFVCVLLVRDRRTWLAVPTCLLWVGRAGVSFLPRVALRVVGNRQWRERFSGCLSSLPWRRYLSCDKLDTSGASVPVAQAEQRSGPVRSADTRCVLFEIYTAGSLAPVTGPAAHIVSVLIRWSLARGPPLA